MVSSEQVSYHNWGWIIFYTLFMSANPKVGWQLHPMHSVPYIRDKLKISIVVTKLYTHSTNRPPDFNFSQVLIFLRSSSDEEEFRLIGETMSTPCDYANPSPAQPITFQDKQINNHSSSGRHYKRHHPGSISIHKTMICHIIKSCAVLDRQIQSYKDYIDGLVQDCSKSNVNTLMLLQYSARPSISLDNLTWCLFSRWLKSTKPTSCCL